MRRRLVSSAARCSKNWVLLTSISTSANTVATSSKWSTPPATPATVADYLHEQIVDILSDPDFEHRLLNMGLVPIGNTPSDYAKNIEADTAKYRELIRISGASIE